MDKYKEQYLKETEEIFKCLGDKTRIEILLAMKDGEKCVHDISEITEHEISNISHHLRRLKDKRLVDYRKEGRHKYYRIDDEHVLTILQEGLEHARE